MKVTVTVRTLRKQGILASVSVHLIRAGLTLSRHETQDIDADHQRMVLQLETPEPSFDQAKLAGLSNLQGVVEVESIEAAGAVLKNRDEIEPGVLQKRLADAFQEIVRKPASTVTTVRNLETQIGSLQGSKALFALGKQLGARAYKKDYALGSPQPLADNVIRMLKPALRPLAEVASFSEDAIFVNGCPFSHEGREETTSCSFLRGYMQGFLMSSPKSSDVEVEQPLCKKIGGFCTFRSR